MQASSCKPSDTQEKWTTNQTNRELGNFCWPEPRCVRFFADILHSNLETIHHRKIMQSFLSIVHTPATNYHCYKSQSQQIQILPSLPSYALGLVYLMQSKFAYLNLFADSCTVQFKQSIWIYCSIQDIGHHTN